MENKIQLVFEKEYSDKTELKFLPFITKMNACVSDEDYKALDNREKRYPKIVYVYNIEFQSQSFLS